ncbi:MAG TPA: DNA polymerase, partial [Patescibacteria group bacterium]|nr:DNA polymerase [Patescibacteria group bacterium]
TWEPGVSYVVALEHPSVDWDIPISSVYAALNVALEGKEMVGHNVKFDMAWMLQKGVKLHAKFDTLLAAHLLDENRPNGLKSLSRTFLGADEYEANIDFRTPHSLGPLATYNGKDTDYTLRLYHIFRAQLKDRPRLLRLFKLLVMPACNAYVQIEANGFPVDMERLSERHEFILGKISETTEALLDFVPKEHQAGANFRSPNFLAKFFFGILELPILVITPKSGRPSTAESVLLKLKSKHPAVELLMTLRKWMKYESTYTRNWLARTRSAGKPRLFTSYNISGTVTGRLSSNMQQVPRDVLIRSIIGISDAQNQRRTSKGRQARRFVEADFSQIELRIAAMLSRDPALTRTFKSGGDPHRETAASVTGKAPELITKEERKMAKAVNFGFLYGMGAKKFRIYADEKYQVKVSLDEAIAYRKAFFRQYKGLLPWHDRQRRLVRNLQQVSSPIGRIRHLPAIVSDDDFLAGQAEREAINAPVQGFASDLTVLSMVLLSQKLDHKRGRVIGNVHDAVLFEIDDDYIDEAKTIIKGVMEHLPLKRLFGYSPTIPIEVDIGVGNHWGETDH